MSRFHTSIRRPTFGLLSLSVLLSILPAGSLVAQGVGERVLKRPPYYAGKVLPADASPGHYPIVYRRGEHEAGLFQPDGSPESAVAALLSDMNAYLDSLNRTAPIPMTGPWPSRPPMVVFGCRMDAAGDCTDRDDEVRVQRGTELLLRVERPSKAWIAWARGGLDSAGASHAIVVTLEVSQYWTRQVNLKGDKVVDLGTGHAVKLPWLTSLETPVSVLQLTAAVVDREGRVVRIGAEGLLARRTTLMPSSVGLQALLREEDVAALRAARRDDLPGTPLVWQVTLDSLLANLGVPAGGRSGT